MPTVSRRSLDDRRRRRDIDAERFVHIGAAALARDRTVAVLRDAQPGRRRHERRRRRNIERAGAIAARAARVEHIVERLRQLHGVGAHRPARARRFRPAARPFIVRPTSSAPICAGVASPLMMARHRVGRLVDREVLAPHQFFQQRRNACAHLITFRKFRSRCCPSRVMIDSGWNCTP